MDKNYNELLEALKSHSKKNQNFITRLEQLKSSGHYFRTFICKLPSIRSPKSDSKQEGSSNIDIPQSDQYEERPINENIQDIINKFEGVEKETEQVVKKLSQYYVSATSKKADVKFPVVQVYERDGNTSEFITAFQKRLHMTFKPDVIVDVAKIDVRKPLLILCQTRSRLTPDIDYSLGPFTKVENISRLGIVIIHSKDEHALPTTSSEYKLCDDKRFKNTWIIDTAFTNDLKFYDCKMNNDAIVKLQNFLKEDTSV